MFHSPKPEALIRVKQYLELDAPQTRRALMDSFVNTFERQEGVELTYRLNALRQRHWFTADYRGWMIRLSEDGEQDLTLGPINFQEYVGACAVIATETQGLCGDKTPADVVDVGNLVTQLSGEVELELKEGLEE